jgi:hypothetical protein
VQGSRPAMELPAVTYFGVAFIFYDLVFVNIKMEGCNKKNIFTLQVLFS